MPVEHVPNWSEYVSGGLLNDQEANMLRIISEKHVELTDENAAVVAEVLDKQISQEVTKFVLNFLHAKNSLHVHDVETCSLLCRAISKIVDRFEDGPSQHDNLILLSRVAHDNPDTGCHELLFGKCRAIFSRTRTEASISAAMALSCLLQAPQMRSHFMKSRRLVEALLSALTNNANPSQFSYVALLCLWQASYDPECVRMIVMDYSIIPAAIAVCRHTTKEKVVRIGLALLRNALEKSRQQALTALIGCKAFDFIENCGKRSFKDEDLLADLRFLHEELESAILNLTTFDEYASEIKSGNLNWTPAHKSPLFWRDNAFRLHENDCELLKYTNNDNLVFRILVHYLVNSQDTKTVSIAAHDLGEYLKHYPAGKRY